MDPHKRPSDLAQPLIFYVTDRKALPAANSRAVLNHIRSATLAGVDFVQIREKDLPAVELLKLATESIRGARKTAGATRIVLNDRLDAALAAEASGVHLGEQSLPPQEVIAWCRAGNAPPDFRVGVSCHGVSQARAAETAGASYVFFGPVFETPSKRSSGPPQGLARLRGVCRAVELPVIAIGGVNESNAADCVEAGASGIAAIRLFQEAPDPGGLALTVAAIHQMRRE